MKYQICHCEDKTCIHNSDGVCAGAPSMEVETFHSYSRGAVTVVVCKSYKSIEEEDDV